MTKTQLIRSLILAGSLLPQLNTLCFHAHGAAGDVDLSFDPGSGVNGTVNAVALQPDGKVVIGGTFTTVKGLARTNLARLNADGSGDSSFAPGAYGAYGLPYSEVHALALQPDGKVLLGHQYGYARLNSDGSVDTSFNPGITTVYDWDNGWFNDASVLSAATQSDGKVLIAGNFSAVNGTNAGYGIARLNANGSLDTNFSAWPGIHGAYGGVVYCMALQSDGRVLVGGQWNTSTSGGTNNSVVRLNANGSLDSSFNAGTDVSGYVHSVALQSDGRVLIGGDVCFNTTNRNKIVRLNANGTLDSGFNPGTGIGNLPFGSGVRSVVVQSDGKVLIGGDFTDVAGTNQNRIARLDANGTLDATFNPGTGVNWMVSCVALQPDGKVLIGGDFTLVNGTNRNRMARLNADGSLDGSFHPGRGVDSGNLVLQPDGKVIVGNVRLNADGSLDSSYIQPTNSSAPFPADLSFPGYDFIDSIDTTCGAVQPDGKHLIGGYFSSTDVDPVEGGITRWTHYFLARFNADASRDTSFEQVIGPPSYDMMDTWWPMSLVLQPNGKALFNPRRSLQCFNPNGTPDASFNPVPGSVFSFRVQADGKIFIAGSFVFVNGQRGIARLNANGSLDTSFNSGTGASQSVGVFVFQPDGKVLIGGEFTTVNGTNRNHIARLNASGSLDLSFNPGIGADGNVSFIALQPDGNVLISGDFLTVNGVLRPYVARLYGDSPWPSLKIAPSSASVIVSWPATGLNLQLQESTDLSLPNSWSPVGQAAVTNAGQISMIVPTTAGQKFFRLESQ
jgi:uncharacterized delta-60 repeat protein